MPESGRGVTQPNVFGIVSLILWSIFVVVTLKYVSFVMRADNDGEGGILALTALATGVAPIRLRNVLLTLGVFGAAMFYGDSMITPAISVISGVEGVTLVDANLTAWIVPISLVILTGLFAIQKHGTGDGGQVVWTGDDRLVQSPLAALGILHIAQRPAILEAASPYYAAAFVANNPKTSFVVLGSVFLALTGGEALYADMGHFGKRSIRFAWVFLVWPSLVMKLFRPGGPRAKQPEGPAAALLRIGPGLGARAARYTGYGPPPSSLPRAVISGAFSMTKQSRAARSSCLVFRLSILRPMRSARSTCRSSTCRYLQRWCPGGLLQVFRQPGIRVRDRRWHRPCS